MQIRYHDDYTLIRVISVKSYVIQMMNKKRARAIIEFDDHIYSSGRRDRKVLYIEKYADELKTHFSTNGVFSSPAQAVVWPKNKFPEGVGATNFPSDKQIKNN